MIDADAVWYVGQLFLAMGLGIGTGLLLKLLKQFSEKL